jgi:hypothetical protein
MMSEDENELKKALAENGSFDTETAKRVAAEAGAWFDRRLKWMARLDLLRIIFCVVVLEVAAAGFGLAVSTKAMIAFAVVLVFAVVGIGSAAVQFRITNTKMVLLKEIKLLRLERLGCPADRVIAPPWETVPSSVTIWRTLSPWESAAWFALLIVIAAVSFVLMSWLMGRDGTLANESLMKLSADGSGTSVSKTSYQYNGLFPMTSASMWTGAGAFKFTRWLDNRGRELPMSVETTGKNMRYTVQLLQPVRPGEEFSETVFGEGPKMAEKKGDLWIYRGDPQFGYPHNSYLATVQLPKGAEIVSVDPLPAEQTVQDGLPTVRFQATRGCNEKFTHTIQYRLPKDGASAETRK